jgi:hypothetical protein
MKRILPIILIVLTVALVCMATIHTDQLKPATTPEGAVQSLLQRAQGHDFNGAFNYVSQKSNTNEQDFAKDFTGRDGSLRTYSSLQGFRTKVLHENDNEALVRSTIEWSTAVGAFYDVRDVNVVREGDSWKVVWPVAKQPKVPPQVIPVNYLRWDIINRGSGDDWGAQNAEAPRVRITSMNAIERNGGTVVLGEIVNEDTVPGFVAVGATLVGKNGNALGQEESFDKISHVLLPKEVSPFRIDFPGVKLANIKSVRMQPTALLVPASADPVMGVLHQRIEKDSRGRTVLTGDLINESGQTVNIPHVLATFYDNAGRVIWVTDGYVDQALLPQTPVPFSVAVNDELAKNIQTYRVTVNQYSLDRREQ